MAYETFPATALFTGLKHQVLQKTEDGVPVVNRVVALTDATDNRVSRVLAAAPESDTAGLVVRVAGPVAMSGTVELGGTSLAALENVTVGGEVSLSSGSLAALENVTVGGTV